MDRNKGIAVIFLILIFAVFSVSVVRSFLPQYQQEEGLTEEEKEILRNNGTIRGEGDAESSRTADGRQPPEDENKPLFTRIQNGIDGFTDNLFGRSLLITFNTKLTYLLTGGTYAESAEVLVGKNGMLFYKTEDRNKGQPIRDYMGINRFSDEELAAVAENLTTVQEYLAAEGIEFYVMCIPNKEIVYEENMPDTIIRIDDESRGEQLAGYMAANTDLVFVYPKEALWENKEKAQLYYLTDTHSNQIGAFVNMQALFQEAYGTHAEIDSVTFEVTDDDFHGDLAKILGISGRSADKVYTFTWNTADPDQWHDQTLLFLGDSLCGFLSYICEGYYKEVYWVNPEDFYYALEAYDPDVIIWENVERRCEIFKAALLDAPRPAADVQ